MTDKMIAHIRENDKEEQTVLEHLMGVAELARSYASKLGVSEENKNGLADIGELMGYLHDLGKYRTDFQNYIKSAAGIFNQDVDENFVDFDKLKGKIDHSTVGAQFLCSKFEHCTPQINFVISAIGLCLVSHHSGLLDCISPEGKPDLTLRLKKSFVLTNFHEAVKNTDKKILECINKIILKPDFEVIFIEVFKNLRGSSKKVLLFKTGQLIRILFSCLIDADRTDTCMFERPHSGGALRKTQTPDWQELIFRLETKLQLFNKNANPCPIDNIRREIAEHCKLAGSRDLGIYTLTVPTGGGKTLSSLRYALHHAKIHGLDRIIYVVPFTTIIDQNASQVREILELESEPFSSIVLEHHSNLEPEKENWRSKITSDNWNAPVIFTTSVQFLEALFGGGTSSVRRMHQLANALIIFDEVQALPIRCVHLFNNSLNFLVETCRSSVVLCTATQPLLNKISEDEKENKSFGACEFNEQSEIIPNVTELFEKLKRVEIRDCRKPEGYNNAEIASLATDEMHKAGNCLVITNTKGDAKNIFQALSPDLKVFHLSTDMCPKHRKKKLEIIREQLGKSPLICVSTQLIEAGVDIDFGTVIRRLAGIDSIAQAAGRCNRHGLRSGGRVLIVNNLEENISRLKDVQEAKCAAERVLEDLKNDSFLAGQEMLSPIVLNRFFLYYYFKRKAEMGYPISVDATNGVGRDDSVFNLLSDNAYSVAAFFKDNNKLPEDKNMIQSFETAGRIFKAIDAPTRGVVVPYEVEGMQIVNDLCSAYEVEKQYSLLKKAQQFSVNIFRWRFDKLYEIGAISEAQPDSGVYYLEKRFYDDNFGINDDSTISQNFLNV